MKRLGLVLIACLLVVCVLPVYGAEAEYRYTENGDGTITVTGYTGYLAELDLPREIDGKLVTAVGEAAFMQQSELSSVTLPDSVKTVGRQAFYGCIRLTGVTLTAVEVLGDEALAACPELRVVELGDKLTTIGKGAFEGCKLLGALTIPKSVTEIGTDAFYGCEQVRLSVGENAYAKAWAESHNIPLSFWESDGFTLLVIGAISAVGAVVLWFAAKWGKAWYVKRKRTATAEQETEAKTEQENA